MNNGLPPGGTVHLEYAKIPKTPESPRPTMNCINCKFWQRDQKQRVAQVQGGGQVAISQLIAAGMKIPPADLIATIAPCSFNPIWSIVTDDHWCWQFKYERQLLEPVSDIDANSV
jgi:hypothetical protein